MFFDFLKKKVQLKFKPKQIQDEYIDLLLKIMSSPLWDGSDEQLLHSLPEDLTADTIAYTRQIFQQKE